MEISPQLKVLIDNKINQIDAVSHLLPGVVIIHHMPQGGILYMSKNGLDLLGSSMEEVRSLSPEEYHNKHFNPDDAKDYVPKMLDWLQRNTDEEITFFQQVKFAKSNEMVWHMSTLKLILRDDAGLPLLAISTSVRIDPVPHVTSKLSRMLEENTFLRKHYTQFSKLTRRERDILRLQVLGNSSQEIADQLFISLTTVETHRRNLKRKLQVSSSFELSEYARAFDLV